METESSSLPYQVANCLVSETEKEMMKKMEVNGITFDLAERYEPIKLIGKGTYGAVISAHDHLTKTKVAIKKLTKIDDLVRHGYSG